MPGNDDVIARIFDVKYDPSVWASAISAAYRSITLPLLGVEMPVGVSFKGVHVPAWSLSKKEIPFPFVIYRGSTGHRTAIYPKMDTPIDVDDIVRTSHCTTMAVELLEGARIGVKKSSTIKILEGDSLIWDHGSWRRIKLDKGGVFDKFHKKDIPMTIKVRGGTMGGKG